LQKDDRDSIRELESLNMAKSVLGKSIVNKIKKKQTLLQHQVKEGLILATRQSVDQLLQQCEDAINLAQDQYKNASMQQHYNDGDFTNALQALEDAYNDLAKLALSANSQQREQLHRMRLQLQQVQNNMILLDH
jgi:hypothetical protein